MKVRPVFFEMFAGVMLLVSLQEVMLRDYQLTACFFLFFSLFSVCALFRGVRRV
jgi:hypothetical protein